MSDEKLFFMVVPEGQRGAVGQFDDGALAIEDAEKQAQAKPGESVYLLKVVTVYEAEIVVGSKEVGRSNK